MGLLGCRCLISRNLILNINGIVAIIAKGNKLYGHDISIIMYLEILANGYVLKEFMKISSLFHSVFSAVSVPIEFDILSHVINVLTLGYPG